VLRDKIPDAICATWDLDHRPKDKSEREDDDVASGDNERDGDWVDDNESTHLSSNRLIVEIPASKAKEKGHKPASPGMDWAQGKNRHSLPIIVPPALKRKQELDKDSGPVDCKKFKDSHTGQSNALFT
jgi:hypothetical protein